MQNPTFTQAAREFIDRLGDRSRRAAPQPFAIHCDCGQLIEGERKEKSQTLHCPSCGQKVFALARNPRPEPKLRRGQTEKQPARASRAAEPAAKVAAPADKKPATATPAPSPERELEHVIARELAEPVEGRRWFSAPRLATVGVCLLVLLTGYGVWRQRQTRIYSAQLESATDEGSKLLKAADFVRAAERLTVADRAARGLGADSPQERLAIQLKREADLWVFLSTEPLETFVAQMDAANDDDEAAWNRLFTDKFARRMLVFDTWVSPPTQHEIARAKEDERAPHHAEWLIIGSRLRVQLSLRGLRLIDDLPLDEPQRLIFGATLAGLHKSTTEENTWQIELSPDSGVLVTVAEPLKYYHWPEDESLPEVLKQQQTLLGIE
jgi:DNA-directed RNA polymerase subunit RPC12/RpoP